MAFGATPDGCGGCPRHPSPDCGRGEGGVHGGYSVGKLSRHEYPHRGRNNARGRTRMDSGGVNLGAGLSASGGSRGGEWRVASGLRELAVGGRGILLDGDRQLSATHPISGRGGGGRPLSRASGRARVPRRRPAAGRHEWNPRQAWHEDPGRGEDSLHLYRNPDSLDPFSLNSTSPKPLTLNPSP